MQEVLIQKLKKKVEKNPSSLAFARLADAYREVGNYDEALPLCEQGITQHPFYLMGWIVRARVLIEINHLLEAQEVLNRALVLDSTSLVARRMMGEVLAKLNHLDTAEEQAFALRELDPLGPSVFINRTAPAPKPTTSNASGQSSLNAPAGADVPFAPTLDDDSDLPDDVPVLSDDIEAALDRLLGDDLLNDKKEAKASINIDNLSSDDVSHLLEDALDDMPQDDENVGHLDAFTGDDLDSAFDDMFGSSEDDRIPTGQTGKQATLQEDTPAPNELPPTSESTFFDTNDDFNLDDSLFGEQESTSDGKEVSDTLEQAAEESVSEFASGDAIMDVMDELFGTDDDDLPEEMGGNQGAATDALERSDFSDDLDDIFEEEVKEGSTTENTLGDDIDSAFDDIFGEDELPEEQGSLQPPEGIVQDQSSSLITQDESLQSQPEAAPADGDLGQEIDSAFDDIFGEDELPEEQMDQNAVEMEADLESDLTSELESEIELEPSVEPELESDAVTNNAKASAEDDLGAELDSVMDDIFGEDELPEEIMDELPNQQLENTDSSSEQQPLEELEEEDLIKALDDTDEPELAHEILDLGEEEPQIDLEESNLEGMDSEELIENPLDDEALLDLESELELALKEVSGEEPELDTLDTLDTEEDALSESGTPVLEKDEPEDKLFETSQEDERSIEDEVTATLDSMFGADDDLPEEVSLEVEVENASALEEESLEEESSVDESLEKDSLEEESVEENLDALLNESAPQASDDIVLSGSEVVASDDSDETNLDDLFLDEDDSEDELEAELEDSFTAEESEGAIEENAFDIEASDSDAKIHAAVEADSDEDYDTEPSTQELDILQDYESIGGSPTVTLAEIYLKQNLPEQALEIYRQLLEREPENEEAQKRIAQIEQEYLKEEEGLEQSSLEPRPKKVRPGITPPKKNDDDIFEDL
jgi:pilus assembly protein FimV